MRAIWLLMVASLRVEPGGDLGVRQALGYQPHDVEFAFHGHLTGRENLTILAAARGGNARQQIGPALDRTRLSGRADDKVSAYSMGMRQRPAWPPACWPTRNCSSSTSR